MCFRIQAALLSGREGPTLKHVGTSGEVRRASRSALANTKRGRACATIGGALTVETIFATDTLLELR